MKFQLVHPPVPFSNPPSTSFHGVPSRKGRPLKAPHFLFLSFDSISSLFARSFTSSHTGRKRRPFVRFSLPSQTMKLAASQRSGNDTKSCSAFGGPATLFPLFPRSSLPSVRNGLFFTLGGRRRGLGNQNCKMIISLRPWDSSVPDTLDENDTRRDLFRYSHT